MDEMRKTIAKLTAKTSLTETPKMESKGDLEVESPRYALGFDPKTYLAKGFIESQNWIAEELAPKMKEKMNKEENRWTIFKMKGPPDMRSAVTCATYNRGEGCRQGKWHTLIKGNSQERPTGDARWKIEPSQHQKNELRTHACTLCWKALGVFCMHSVLDCPWLIEENWK
jgi:hypothetical protein